MRIERKVNILSWTIDKIQDIYFYFRVALFETPSVIIFIFMIVIGIYLGIKQLYFNKEKLVENGNPKMIETRKKEINYKVIILSLMLIISGVLLFYEFV